MSAATHNFFIEQGSDFQITFRYLDTNQVPVDLTNYCASLLWKPVTGQGVAQGFSSAVSPNSIGNTPETAWTLKKDNLGNIVFSLGYIFTKRILWSDAVYDLYITDSSNPPKKYRIATGSISIQRDNFPECATSTNGYCADCEALQFQPPTTATTTPTPTGTNGNGSPITTPTPTISDIDLCSTVCNELDLYSVMYTGDGMSITDNAISSGTINIQNTGVIQNIEVIINKLKHSYPQDLSLILIPPTGNKILLSAHNKIVNNNPVNGFSFMFSNKAASGVYLNNASNNSYINILDKTTIYNFNNETLSNTLQDWIGLTGIGNWTLLIKDDDINSSGSIDSWGMVISYEPPPLTIDEI